MFEALIAVESGEPLDAVLEDFARLSAETYAEVGAHELPIQRVSILKGGRK